MITPDLVDTAQRTMTEVHNIVQRWDQNHPGKKEMQEDKVEGLEEGQTRH